MHEILQPKPPSHQDESFFINVSHPHDLVRPMAYSREIKVANILLFEGSVPSFNISRCFPTSLLYNKHSKVSHLYRKCLLKFLCFSVAFDDVVVVVLLGQVWWDICTEMVCSVFWTNKVECFNENVRFACGTFNYFSMPWTTWYALHIS